MLINKANFEEREFDSHDVGVVLEGYMIFYGDDNLSSQKAFLKLY